MNLAEIESLLESDNPQARMKGITELRHYQPNIVVPRLKRLMDDREFLVRSFVAMGLGHKRTDEGYVLLLKILEYETDQNVIAEAANSLAKHGQQSLPHLMRLFEQQSHWLVRQSILAAVAEMESPAQLLRLCTLAYAGDDVIVAQAGLTFVEELVGTAEAHAALDLLLSATTSPRSELRAQTARTLRHFDDPQAAEALLRLRQDDDFKVVGATLEGLLPS